MQLRPLLLAPGTSGRSPWPWAGLGLAAGAVVSTVALFVAFSGPEAPPASEWGVVSNALTVRGTF